MNKEQFANLLNGREYGNEILQAEEKIAKDNGLLVITGYSDDNLEFYGIFREEVGAYDGGEFFFTKDGKFPGEDERETLKKFSKSVKLNRIEAVWAPEDLDTSWLIKSEIPHATFDIMEDGQLFCRGIVIHEKDLK